MCGKHFTVNAAVSCRSTLAIVTNNPLASAREYTTIFPGCIRHLTPFINCQRKRLFTKDIFARLHRINRYLCMPVIRCSTKNKINVITRANLTIIRVCLNTLIVLKLIKLFKLYITCGNKLNSLVASEPTQDTSPLPTSTNNSQRYTFTCWRCSVSRTKCF